ncbi:MAG: DUF2914 domain-containing protein [Elusimicrobiota bacterium]|jgi:hypothetical protein
MKGFLVAIVLSVFAGVCSAQSTPENPASSVPSAQSAAAPATDLRAAQGGANAAGTARAENDQRAAPAPVVVARSAVCTAIQDREPVGAAAAGVPIQAGMIYFWNELKASSVPTTVKHRWSRDGRPAGESTLSLKHRKTRTWSTRQAGPGDWKVEVLSSSGEVLRTAGFKVVK